MERYFVFWKIVCGVPMMCLMIWVREVEKKEEDYKLSGWDLWFFKMDFADGFYYGFFRIFLLGWMSFFFFFVQWNCRWVLRWRTPIVNFRNFFLIDWLLFFFLFAMELHMGSAIVLQIFLFFIFTFFWLFGWLGWIYNFINFCG